MPGDQPINPENEKIVPVAERGPLAPEALPEQYIEQPERRPAVTPAEKVGEAAPVAPAISTVPTGVVKPQSELQGQVEKILSEDLEETYRNLDPVTKEQFKRVGEETAIQVAALLQETKIKIKKIIGLIFSWLRIIPGVNKHFLEQEAKIKADKLLHLRRPPSV